jgi:sugar phosphate isomerase/epimerase
MISRRSFVKSSAAALPLLAIHGRDVWAAGDHPLGVQLYTVRGLIKQDLAGTLREIREIGYTEVETFGDSYTYPAKELRQIIDGAGLRVPSGHFDYAGLRDSWPDKLDYARQLGLKWVVCPSLPTSMWTAEGFREGAQLFNALGGHARDEGMRFAFHNHDYEFRDYGGKTGYEILTAETDPARVFFELDCYWAAQAGYDPFEVVQKMKRRIRLLHLKDRKAGFPTSFDTGSSSGHFAPVGQGAIAWKPILDLAESLGVELYFVEQDTTYGHPIESIRLSYRYLRPLIA